LDWSKFSKNGTGEGSGQLQCTAWLLRKCEGTASPHCEPGKAPEYAWYSVRKGDKPQLPRHLTTFCSVKCFHEAWTKFPTRVPYSLEDQFAPTHPSKYCDRERSGSDADLLAAAAATAASAATDGDGAAAAAAGGGGGGGAASSADKAATADPEGAKAAEAAATEALSASAAPPKRKSSFGGLPATRAPHQGTGSDPVPGVGFAPPLHTLLNGLLDDDNEWRSISSEKTYCPTADDVGRPLRLEVRALKHTGRLLIGPRNVVTEPVLSVPPMPPKRSLLMVKNAGSGGGVRFRVLTYNLLAEIYATQQMYPYCDFWALKWSYRVENLMRELADAQADILCLQEVQADHYEEHLLPRLSAQGYEGLYKQKTRDAMGLAGKVDGCATFWRRSKFRLAEHYSIEYNECARQTVSQLGCTTEDEERECLGRLMKDNVAQILVFEVLMRVRGGGRQATQLCVANTHLYSHPEFPDVKLWQVRSPAARRCAVGVRRAPAKSRPAPHTLTPLPRRTRSCTSSSSSCCRATCR